MSRTLSHTSSVCSSLWISLKPWKIDSNTCALGCTWHMCGSVPLLIMPSPNTQAKPVMSTDNQCWYFMFLSGSAHFIKQFHFIAGVLALQVLDWIFGSFNFLKNWGVRLSNFLKDTVTELEQGREVTLHLQICVLDNLTVKCGTLILLRIFTNLIFSGGFKMIEQFRILLMSDTVYVLFLVSCVKSVEHILI